MRRISERVREELSAMLVKEVADPRLAGIQITEVKVDRELAYADVFVSAVEGVERSAEILAGLRHAAGFFRSELAARVELRAFPRLRFHWDPTPENADRIERVLAQIRAETPTPVEPPDEDTEDAADEA
ncbi:MAG: 30S ribosome-binding factor RbfA [Anaerolineaceae bacterium]|nr:30S ribosome-binding factor RbfA [Anaerolineaceae bacterium]